jgi:WD40 repeat protein
MHDDSNDELTQLIRDAGRFIMYYKRVVESYPLQPYASALLFSPTGSVIRRLFQHEQPSGVTVKPATSDGWSACLQTLEGHSSEVSSVAFSHDSSKLASASGDNTVKVWNASSGACLQTLNIGKALYHLSFDPTSSFLHSEIGSIAIHGPETSSEIAVVEPALPQYLGTSLSSDSIWIKYGGRNLLWIPSEYRPSRSAVCGNRIGMGVATGRVWTCSVDPDTLTCMLSKL